MLKSLNTLQLDQELNSIMSRIGLRKMMYYLRHEILLIARTPVCFLGPDILPYEEPERNCVATSVPPFHKHCTRLKELSTLQQSTWP